MLLRQVYQKKKKETLENLWLENKPVFRIGLEDDGPTDTAPKEF